MEHDIQKLRKISSDVWEPYKVYCNWKNGTETHYKIARCLTNEEVRFLYKCVHRHGLIVEMYTAGNRGIGIRVLEPDPTIGKAPFPGIEYSIVDLKPIITVWYEHIHIFKSEPIDYKFGSWCKRKGYYDLGKIYQFFSIFTNHRGNLDLMERYNLPKPHLKSVEYFEY